MRHQQRTLSEVDAADRGGVHQPDALGHRVDPERGPRQVEEREGRQHGDVDPLVRAQQVDGALGDQGRAGHGIDHRLGCRSDCRGDQLLDYGGVDLLERRRGLVEVVEGVQSSERCGRGVASGPHVGRRRRQERRGVLAQELGAGGPEAHHGDVGAGRHG